MDYCRYCQVEDTDGRLCESEGCLDLIHYDFRFMGEELSMDVSIEQGKLVFTNFDYNRFLEQEINYCPMCGRKLEHWEVD